MTKVVIFGDVNPNLIDGSSIWLMSISEVLSRVVDEVHVQLKAPLYNRRLVSAVDSIDNIVLHEPDLDVQEELSPKSATGAVASLSARVAADLVIVRGFEAANQFCMNGELSPKLWSYITELPFPPEKISKNNKNRLERISQRSRRMFVQTEDARSYLESIAPSAAGKTLLLPPMIPDFAYDAVDKEYGIGEHPLRIVYAGKFAKEWKTLEMLDLPRALRNLGVPAELHVIGDKYNRARDAPSWLPTMQESIKAAAADPESGVVWYGAMSREETVKVIANCDLGLGWRTEALDSSLEISTKALEYGAARIAPIVNRTADHESLFGVHYPLFCSSSSDVDDLAQVIKTNLGEMELAVERAREVSDDFSMAKARKRFVNYFNRAGIGKQKPSGDVAKTKIVVASHDMKFMGELMDHLNRNPAFEVRQDNWETLHKHDEQISSELAEWADVVFCEWAGPSLAWFSQNKPSKTRLISRLHRFELGGPWLADVRWEQVDGMIFVSELYRRMALEQLPIRDEITHVIPNAVDSLDFDRPKSSSARFTLGFIGMVPYHKRLDRALVLLKELLRHDARYVLRVKGRMPWDYPYEWRDPIQRQLYLEIFNWIGSDEELSEHVVFDRFSADVASWQRDIGFMLSPSEVESFHMAPAEGMAARSIPIFWERPGVDEIFGEQYASKGFDAMVAKILECRSLAKFNEYGEEARESVKRWDPTVLMPQWESVFKAEKLSAN